MSANCFGQECLQSVFPKLTNPDGFEVSHGASASDVTPPRRIVLVLGLVDKAEHVAQLLAHLDLGDGADGARLEGDVVGVVHHGHHVAQHGRHGQVGTHVGLVARGPERDGVAAQHGRRLLHRRGDPGRGALELGRVLDGLGDEGIPIGLLRCQHHV